ncbi:hypothetical protein KIN20_002558 [Parelaphostrongylus tenuis]|uniref:Uncharacterized protein n=1 Tax=Parelaphostrongylus tenuis TaxID=148309 RepID=A0AAD5LVE7_PARTN|nr:hypothetical protein KIN20_002558 [Parelaphostrongylus tenuis]
MVIYSSSENNKHPFLLEERLHDWKEDIEDRIRFGIEAGKERGVIKSGDALIAVTGWHQDARNAYELWALVSQWLEVSSHAHVPDSPTQFKWYVPVKSKSCQKISDRSKKHQKNSTKDYI